MAWYRCSSGGGTLTETVLWTDDSPTTLTTGTVTLSESLSNFSSIRVYYRVSASDATEYAVDMDMEQFKKTNSILGFGCMYNSNYFAFRGLRYVSDTTVNIMSGLHNQGGTAGGDGTHNFPTKITGLK